MTAGGSPESAAAEVGSAPSIAATVFGDRLSLAARYAEQLATVGVERGLLGPREAPRIWERHLLNCAVLTELLPPNARVVDVGSGAGLPGVVLACRRPDVRVDLVEPSQRRSLFLAETMALLGLGAQARVVRGRAEDAAVRSTVGESLWVTARAVAPLGQLVGWCLPMVAPGGSFLAMKGDRAQAEVEEFRRQIDAAGGDDVRIVHCGEGLVAQPATVVVVRRRANSPLRSGRRPW